MNISPDSFALLCFIILMENGRGLIDKSPSYITEKSYLQEMGLHAFGALDIHNMRKVIDYCATWKIELPAKVAEEWQRRTQAETELTKLGIEF